MPRFEDRVLRIERISKGRAYTAGGESFKLKTVMPIRPPPDGPPPPRSGLERFATARREQAKAQREMKKREPAYIYESDEDEE